mgnify:CR=1 FL=1
MRQSPCVEPSGNWLIRSGYDERPAYQRLLRTPAAVILYEYPFNERIRTYLRLEHLFRRLAELLPRTQALDHHFAIQTIFEIMDVASRVDMKSDVLKDIERHKQQLNSYRGNPAISEVTGKIGGSITSGGTLTIDVGDLSNLNQGRNAPNVQDGAAMANLNVQGPKTLPDGPGHGGACLCAAYLRRRLPA